MRIAIIALGSQGDVQPYIALGKGLAAAGHVIRLVTHENFAALVRSRGAGILVGSGRRSGIHADGRNSRANGARQFSLR